MKYTFNFRDIWTQWEFIAEGIGVTLALTAIKIVYPALTSQFVLIM